MKGFLFVIALAFVLSTSAYSQCKTITKGGALTRLEKWYPVNLQTTTKYKKLFEKPFVIASQMFFKTESGDYFFAILLNRNYGSKIWADEETPAIFFMDDGSELILKPVSQIDGRRATVRHLIGLYYKVSKEELEVLASSYITSMNIYFLSEDDIADALMDDIGTYLDYKINSEASKNRVTESANCILQY